jgi:hypothetical protein
VAIARLTGQDAKGVSTTTSVTATYPGTPTRNNLLIATVYSNTVVGTNVLSGWSVATDQQVGNNVQDATIFYKVAGAAESTGITATATGATIMKLHIYEYSGTATSSPLLSTNNGNGGAANVTSQATNSLTIAGSELLFVTVGLGGNVTTPAWDSSFSLRQSDAAIRLFDGDRIGPGAGSYSSSASWVGATKATAIIAAFGALALPPPRVISQAANRASTY